MQAESIYITSIRPYIVIAYHGMYEVISLSMLPLPSNYIIM